LDSLAAYGYAIRLNKPLIRMFYRHCCSMGL